MAQISTLPHLAATPFLTDSGLETWLIFHKGLELPLFASFVLLKTAEGRATLKRYYADHAAVAARHGAGFLFESASWRASPDWAEKLGYDAAALAEANRTSIRLMAEVRDELKADDLPMALSGCLGPRGDGYIADAAMTAEQAAAFHAPQVAALTEAGADLVSAFTMTNTAEAIGIARAAKAAGIPCVLSFTVETDGRLPSGISLKDAILRTDEETDGSPAYYMINCAHPTHFESVLEPGAPWAARIRGVRANASVRSHAELDEAPDLDDGDPATLGGDYARLRRMLPSLSVLGGCCGTDLRHVGEIAKACLPLDRRAAA